MADAKSVVELIFEATDKTGAATLSALKNTEKFASSVQSATQPIADFTFAALKFEAALLSAGVAMTAFGVKAAGDFDTAFREISTLIQVPIDDLGEFRDAILSYASTSTQPLEEVTASIYTAISAGAEYAEAIDVITVAEKLAVGGRAELDATTKVLVSSLNAYGLGMENASQFSDILFTTVKEGITTIPELAESLSNVTGTAAVAGVDFAELNAAIATMTSLGTKTPEAITAINSVLQAFIKPSSQAAALAEELGLDFSLTALRSDGLQGSLLKVVEATGGSEEKMAQLFGKAQALKAVFPLVGTAADQFADKMEAMKQATGATEAAFAKMAESMDYSVQKIKYSLNTFFIAIGDPLLDEFGGVAEAIAEIFDALTKSASSETGEGIAQVINFIEEQFGSLEDTLSTVAENLPAALGKADFSGFINGVTVITDALGSVFEDIDFSTVDGLAKGITLVGNAFEALSQYSAGVVDSFKPLANLFFDVGSGLGEIDGAAYRSAGELAGFVTQLNLLSGPAITVAATLISLKSALDIASVVKAATVALGSAAGGGLIGTLGALGAAGVAGAAGYTLGTIANTLSEMATGQTLSTWAVDLAGSLGLVEDKSFDIVAGLNDVVPAVKKVAETSDDSSGSLWNLTTGVGKLDDELQEIIVTAQRWPDLGADIDKASAAMTKLNEESAKNELEKQLAIIEAQTEISVANIEADAKKTVAAFDSVTVSIQTTGENLRDLYGLFSEADSISDKFFLEDQIELQNERQQEALDKQGKLIDAQIAELRAKAKRLESGDTLITINGDGLQPHLEAFMWEILETLQVRVNADGLDMLLGAP